MFEIHHSVFPIVHFVTFYTPDIGMLNASHR